MTPAEKRRRDRRRQVVELRAKGWSLRVIARHLEVGLATVHDDLKRSESNVQNRTPSVRKSAAKPNAVDWSTALTRDDLPREGEHPVRRQAGD